MSARSLVAAPADHAVEAGDVVDFDGLGVTEVLLVHPRATSSHPRPGERAVRLDVRIYRDVGRGPIGRVGHRAIPRGGHLRLIRRN